MYVETVKYILLIFLWWQIMIKPHIIQNVKGCKNEQFGFHKRKIKKPISILKYKSEVEKFSAFFGFF